MSDLKVSQLRPPQAENLAKMFEEYAEQARNGEITGFNGIMIRPGGGYCLAGFSGKDANLFEQMGMLFTCIMDTIRESLDAAT